MVIGLCVNHVRRRVMRQNGGAADRQGKGTEYKEFFHKEISWFVESAAILPAQKPACR
jgi:hypothetical protein